MTETIEEIKEETIETEEDKVAKWREEFFSNVLGSKAKKEDIEALVQSDASPHEALKLRNMECPDHLIVAILV